MHFFFYCSSILILVSLYFLQCLCFLWVNFFLFVSVLLSCGKCLGILGCLYTFKSKVQKLWVYGCHLPTSKFHCRAFRQLISFFIRDPWKSVFIDPLFWVVFSWGRSSRIHLKRKVNVSLFNKQTFTYFLLFSVPCLILVLLCT